jgi:dihydroxy-acid dehydratase
LIGKIHNGDLIRIDLLARTLELLVSDTELATRKSPPMRPLPAGYLSRYQKLVQPASQGAVLR